jgi:hypothetical protein
MPWTVSDVDRFKSGLTHVEKERWVAIANSALTSCLSGGGTQANCEASAIRQANGIVGNGLHVFRLAANNYSIRTEMHQGRKHLVVPVVMLTEGVHNNNGGRVLYLTEEIVKCLDAWNGVPVTIQHPEEDGTYVSANNPATIDSQSTGRIYNADWVDGKLKAEAWLDEEKLKQLSALAYGHIIQGRPLEVSTGHYSNNEFTSGEWNGEEYEAIARNQIPDHLALLPGGVGACSWEDGCGIRANKKEGGNDVEIKVNGAGFKKICNTIQSKLDGMDTDVKFHYLKEVFDDTFIFEVRNEGSVTFFERGYSVNEVDESIEFTGEPAQVIHKDEFVPVQTNEEGGEIMDKKGKKVVEPCCPEQVKTIITSNQTRFVEADREWLESQDKERLIQLLPMEVDDPPVAPQVNREQAMSVLKDIIKTPDDFISLAPDEMQDQLRSGMVLHNAERERMISHISANAAGIFTDDELKAKSTSELQKLAQAIKPQPDYSFSGGGAPKVSANVVEPLLPAGVQQDN